MEGGGWGNAFGVGGWRGGADSLGTEGIFRLSPSHLEVSTIKDLYDSGAGCATLCGQRRVGRADTTGPCACLRACGCVCTLAGLAGKDPDLEAKCTSPHTAAALLKLFFRKMPEPLLTFELYDCFMAANCKPTTAACPGPPLLRVLRAAPASVAYDAMRA